MKVGFFFLYVKLMGGVVSEWGFVWVGFYPGCVVAIMFSDIFEILRILSKMNLMHMIVNIVDIYTAEAAVWLLF